VFVVRGAIRCCCFDLPFPDDLLTFVIVTLNPSPQEQLGGGLI
jgi:hypothetical protein